MFDCILVPLDGSDLAEQSLPHAVSLARAFRAGLVRHGQAARRPVELRDVAGGRHASVGALGHVSVGRLQEVPAAHRLRAAAHVALSDVGHRRAGHPEVARPRVDALSDSWV